MAGQMEQDNLDDELIEAAETIADLWTYLSIATANKLRTIQGLKPIEFAPNENGEH